MQSQIPEESQSRQTWLKTIQRFLAAFVLLSAGAFIYPLLVGRYFEVFEGPGLLVRVLLPGDAATWVGYIVFAAAAMMYARSPLGVQRRVPMGLALLGIGCAQSFVGGWLCERNLSHVYVAFDCDHSRYRFTTRYGHHRGAESIEGWLESLSEPHRSVIDSRFYGDSHASVRVATNYDEPITFDVRISIESEYLSSLRVSWNPDMYKVDASGLPSPVVTEEAVLVEDLPPGAHSLEFTVSYTDRYR